MHPRKVNPRRFFDGKEKARINELSKWIQERTGHHPKQGGGDDVW
jgi:hypothetical protein